MIYRKPKMTDPVTSTHHWAGMYFTLLPARPLGSPAYHAAIKAVHELLSAAAVIRLTDPELADAILPRCVTGTTVGPVKPGSPL